MYTSVRLGELELEKGKEIGKRKPCSDQLVAQAQPTLLPHGPMCGCGPMSWAHSAPSLFTMHAIQLAQPRETAMSKGEDSMPAPSLSRMADIGTPIDPPIIPFLSLPLLFFLPPSHAHRWESEKPRTYLCLALYFQAGSNGPACGT
jgi:hypothetical protein